MGATGGGSGGPPLGGHGGAPPAGQPWALGRGGPAAGPAGGPQGEKSAHKTMISCKNQEIPYQEATRGPPQVGCSVRAIDSTHQEDWGKHLGSVLGSPR